MAHIYIEHVNLTVSDPDRSCAMLAAIFGWKERWRGQHSSGGHTVHVGSDDFYLALFRPKSPLPDGHRFNKGAPFNHVGIVVDDLEETERRAIAFGLQPFAHGDYEPGRRFYFFDRDGIEFEIISYAAIESGRPTKHEGFVARLAELAASNLSCLGFRTNDDANGLA